MTNQTRKMTKNLITLGAAVAVALTPALTGSAAATSARPWMNTALTPEQRAKKLLKVMNLEQKVTLVHGVLTSKGPIPSVGTVKGIPELGIPDFVHSDGPAGVRNGTDPATKFPSPIAYAASWDRSIAALEGRIAGEEAQDLGTDLLYGPGFNIARNPLAGRTFEYYGEDPYLSGIMAAANVRAIQSTGTVATLKHYVANNQETNRMLGSSNVPDRALHEIYMKPFEIAIKYSQPGAVMCSYNAINHEHGCSSYYNLVTNLRDRMGFTGLVVTDYPASWDVTDLKNGLNIEMPGTFRTSLPLVKAALDRGDITMKDLDTRVKETLTVMFHFGLFDKKKDIRPINVERGYQAAQKIAENGAVLLKNKNNALPLNPKTTRKIAVIGDSARLALGGGGSSNVISKKRDNALDEITKRSQGAKVTFNGSLDPLGAANNAKDADVALVFVEKISTELFDNVTLNLKPADENLIKTVAAANKKTIVIINSGNPIAMPWINDVAGVLDMWQPGAAGGSATAALLYGDVNPSGRLPQTFPATDGQWPANTMTQFPGDWIGTDVNYSEGIWVGYRWYQQQNKRPLFPFGYGLSYTTFAYSAPRLAATSGSKSAPVKVTFTITNTGKRTGASAAQVYVGKPKSGLAVPQKELGAFTKVYLQPGESKTVTVTIDPLQLSVWNSKLQKFLVKSGVYKIYIGQNVDNTPLYLTYTVR